MASGDFSTLSQLVRNSEESWVEFSPILGRSLQRVSECDGDILAGDFADNRKRPFIVGNSRS